MKTYGIYIEIMYLLHDVKVYGYTCTFSLIFIKGSNFYDIQFVFLVNIAVLYSQRIGFAP